MDGRTNKKNSLTSDTFLHHPFFRDPTDRPETCLRVSFEVLFVPTSSPRDYVPWSVRRVTRRNCSHQNTVQIQYTESLVWAFSVKNDKWNITVCIVEKSIQRIVVTINLNVWDDKTTIYLMVFHSKITELRATYYTSKWGLLYDFTMEAPNYSVQLPFNYHLSYCFFYCIYRVAPQIQSNKLCVINLTIFEGICVHNKIYFRTIPFIVIIR